MMATTAQRVALPGPDSITRAVLQNGITALIYENHAAQSVVITGLLPAGSSHERAAQTGLASMTAHALMRGTQARDFEAIHTALEDIGADLDFDGGVHSVSFSGKALAEDLPLLIDILSDALQQPAFPEQQVERLRGEMITGLQYRQQDTRYRANRAFRENLYPENHPYHYPTGGTLQTIPELKAADLRGFHAHHYGPQGMIVVIVGAVESDGALETTRARLEAWHNPRQSPATELPPVAPPAQARRAAVSLPGKTQSDIVLGTLGPSRSAADYQAAALANSVLGEFGMMGRIGDVVREQAGLAYYAYSRLEGGQGPGPWQVTAGVNPANVEAAIEKISDEIRRLTTEPVSDEDLSDNQAYFTGHLPLQLENNEGIAGTLLHIERYNLGLDYLLRYRDIIYGLTKEHLLAAAQHYWNPDALVLGVAGPGD